MITRRALSLGLAAMPLAGCVSTGAATGTGTGASAWPAVPDAGFDDWLAGRVDRAAARGVSAPSQAALARAGFIPAVLDKQANQTEFTRTTEDYLAIATSPERVSKGRAQYAARAATFAALEARYGVEGEVLCAIWGLESRYGERMGDAPLISALATLAYAGSRSDFFESQLFAALEILDRGHVPADRMTGSWAGAMGHTQFIPTTFLAYAADGTGDGRADIWGPDPTDALASAARYLDAMGWSTGLPATMEVRLPAGFDTGLAGRGRGRSAESWEALGLTAARGGGLASGSVILTGGPAFLVTSNFNVLLRYNNAVNYALGVGALTDRIAGASGFARAFPPDASGMTLADRQSLQRRLTALGYDTGGDDGVIGDKTRAAIAAYQRDQGLVVTGEPSPALLARL